MKNAHSGFTLIEMLITLMIVALVVTLGIPSMTETIRNNRLSSQANDFISALNLARSEAVKRGQNVTVCSSSDQASCTGTAWHGGWVLLVTTTGDLIRAHEAMSGGSTLANVEASTSLQYTSSGFLNGNAARTFNLCSEVGKAGRRIAISATGRPSSITPYPTC